MNAFLVLTISALSIIALTGCSPAQKEISRQISPNNRLVAVLMESGNGDAIGSVHQSIYLNDQGIPLSLDKPIFNGTGCDHLRYQWINEYTLEIRYETTCAISHFTNRWDRPSDVAAGKPNPIEIMLVRG